MSETNSTSTDQMAELLAAVNRETETWDRDLEPSVAGHVLALGEVTTDHGVAPTITILTGEGREVLVMGFGTVLQRGIYESDVAPGDLFAVKYLGQKTPKSGGKAYHDFKLVVRNGDNSPKGSRPTTATTPADELVDDLLPALPGEEAF